MHDFLHDFNNRLSGGSFTWPDDFPNVWIGTTVENQKEADLRIPLLLKTPAHVRFLSCEPLLGGLHPILRIDSRGRDLTSLPGLWSEDDSCIHWIIVGAESGHGAREMQEDWVRELRDKCSANRIAFFYKQRLQDGKKITMPMLDGVIHNAMPNGHKRSKEE
jgi:protein gp37